MFSDNVPIEPKPFFWIDIEKENPPKKARPTLHQRFEALSGRMTLEIEVISEYLYVGSGLLELDEKERAYYTFARRNRQLVIPATGIKGAVRSVVEMISNSCVSQTTQKERGRLPYSHSRCQKVARGEEVRAGLCPACRLFGTTGYRGRVHFVDAIPVGEASTEIVKISDLWPPRQSKSRKFYQSKTFERQDDRPEKNHRFLEVVPNKTCFTTTLFFENVSLAEMGLLVRAIGLECIVERKDEVVCAFPIKLGGAKPRCLGAVFFHPKNIRLISNAAEGLFQALSEGGRSSSVQATLLEWLKDKTMLDGKAWERFSQEARVKAEPCPKELY